MDIASATSGSLRLEDQLCFALYSTVHAVGRTYGALLPDLNLTYPQYLVMLVLWEEDDMAVKQLGERLFLDSGTLTPLLKRLQGAGLVERERDLVDERRVRIRLTDRGRELKNKALCLPERVAAAMDRPVDQIVRLRDDLLHLRSKLIATRDEGDDRRDQS